MSYVSPELLFFTEGPSVPEVEAGKYYDKTQIGTSNYLDFLPSIALYGIQYKVFIDKSNRVLDGNFRGYGALELGILVPVSIQTSMNYYNVWILRIIRRIRLLFKKNYLFYKKLQTGDMKISKGSLAVKFQINIFDLYR